VITLLLTIMQADDLDVSRGASSTVSEPVLQPKSRATVHFSASSIFSTQSERKMPEYHEYLAMLRRNDATLLEERQRLSSKYPGWMSWPAGKIEENKELVRHLQKTLWVARQWSDLPFQANQRHPTRDYRGDNDDHRRRAVPPQSRSRK
jgi:hypothetical protein